MLACPRGFYGKDCVSQCLDCPLNFCYPNNGSCVCPSGWTGENCSQGQLEYISRFCMTSTFWMLQMLMFYTECGDGFYGPNCELTCNCKNGFVCDRFNGTCMCPVGMTGPDCTQGMGLKLPDTLTRVFTHFMSLF